MKITIVTADSRVIVNGYGLQIDLSQFLLPFGLRAMQWHGTTGEEEYINQQNQIINTLQPYDDLIAEHARLKSEAERVVPPTAEDMREIEKGWAMNELSVSDRCFTPDFPITADQLQLITEYREKLRNPARENHPDYPNQSWRPAWPDGVKRPAG